MLIRQSDMSFTHLEENSFTWAKSLFEQIKNRFSLPAGTKDGFPCVFAQNAFARSNMYFLFIPFDDDQQAYNHQIFAEGLKLYLARVNSWNGDVNAIEPLLVVFQPYEVQPTVSYFENIFVSALQYLIDNDPSEWVGGIPIDPNAEFWTMSFCGKQIFVNASHPLHKNRRSRNLCDTLTLVINLRERFDVVAGNNKKGHAIRSRIRQNINIYDNIPHSPFLGHYQAGDLEWPQYMLPDDNNSPPLKCPLKFP